MFCILKVFLHGYKHYIVCENKLHKNVWQTSANEHKLTIDSIKVHASNMAILALQVGTSTTISWGNLTSLPCDFLHDLWSSGGKNDSFNFWSHKKNACIRVVHMLPSFTLQYSH